jgi:catechol 2,3-dioxygenase-like lactoylglutathione lyase family enzyme
MIDHVSIGVRDLAAATRFYEALLGPLGYRQAASAPATVGFLRHGKTHAEFWLNHRPGMTPLADSGMHICLRALSTDVVDAFHAAALKAGGQSDGAPGVRRQYSENYYAAFVRDPDGNRIEAATFINTK